MIQILVPLSGHLIKVFFLDLLADRAVVPVPGLLLDDQVAVIDKKVWFLIYIKKKKNLSSLVIFTLQAAEGVFPRLSFEVI